MSENAKGFTVLGVHAQFYQPEVSVNESSVSLVRDGKLISCIAQERLSRKKVDGRFPNEAIAHTLERNNLTANDIDALAITSLHPFDDSVAYAKAVASTFQDTGVLLKDKAKTFGYNALYAKLKTQKQHYYELDGKKFQLHYTDHHMAHAAGAYYASPFDDALVITLDGGGNGLDGGAYIAQGTHIQRFIDIPHFQSPGTMYSAVTHDLGFKRHRHEGKITGLAAYGNPDVKRLGLENLIRYDNNKHRFVSKGIAEHHKNLLGKSGYFGPLMDKFPREDLAAVCQQIFEDETRKFVLDAVQVAKTMGFESKNICLAGGCFANVKLNQRILDLEPFENLFVYPAMGDDGLSGGAALYHYYLLNPDAPREASKIENTYLGFDFTEAQMEEALKEFGLKYERFDPVEEEIARLLAAGKIVARYNGRMEYGPRALGNRSILGAPFDKDVNNWLNEKLQRTEFMPFAPSCTFEAAPDYFVGWKPEHKAAEFMTITYDIHEGMAEKIPAVVHVDNTARPQVVRKDINPSYHRIIERFGELSGVPVVLNTSFNMHEEPIVYTPSDGIRGFLDGKLNVLAMGPFIVHHPDL